MSIISIATFSVFCDNPNCGKQFDGYLGDTNVEVVAKSGYIKIKQRIEFDVHFCSKECEEIGYK